MQLDAVTEIWVFCASLKFAKRIIFERIEAAKYSKALWKQGGLGGYPVILCLNLCVLVLRLVSL